MLKNIFIIISLSFAHADLLAHITFSINKYNDIEATIVHEKQSIENFEQELIELMPTWQAIGDKAVWLTIPVKYSSYIPIALQHSFIYHHTTTQELVMIHALKNGAEKMLPAYATQTLGAFGLVIDNDNNVLVVKERFSPDLGYKLPGGGANFAEKISDAAIREVKEETGIDTEFLGIIAWRHHQKWKQEISDMCFCCLLRPLSHSIKIQEDEIIECRWMPYDKLKQVARHLCAQFLTAYEACRAINICYSVHTSDYLDLYVPRATNLTNVIIQDSQ